MATPDPLPRARGSSALEFGEYANKLRRKAADQRNQLTSLQRFIRKAAERKR